MVIEPWPARTGALALAMAAHAVFFMLFVWRLGSTPEPAAMPVMNVELSPPWHDRTRSPRPRPPRTAGHAREPAASGPAPRTDDRPAAAEERVTKGAADHEPDAVRQALRRGLGCRHAGLLGLTPEERRRCEDRAAAAGPAERAPPRLDLDRDGAFAAGRNPEPYLARKPKNGCKLRAAGDTTPAGDQGPAAGVGCAWAF
jgi:hypothetical protein